MKPVSIGSSPLIGSSIVRDLNPYAHHLASRRSGCTSGSRDIARRKPLGVRIIPAVRSLLRCTHRQRLRKSSRWFTIKQNLRIKTFVGTSPNALLIQIWTALIAVLILKYLKFRSLFQWSLSVTLHINLMPFFHIRLMSCKNIRCRGFVDHRAHGRSYPQPSFRPSFSVKGMRPGIGCG